MSHRQSLEETLTLEKFCFEEILNKELPLEEILTVEKFRLRNLDPWLEKFRLKKS